MVPLLVFAAITIGLAPWLHPSNTCHEWLTKWGQLSSDPMWLPVHQFTMAGFLAAAGAAILFPVLGRRSTSAVIGGATLAVGSMVTGGSVLIHASAVSSLGRAFIAARSAELQQSIRATAEAFVSYDESAHGVASALISFGCVMIILALVQEGVVSRVAGVFLAGLGAIWAAHRYHVFNRLGFSISETTHWDSLALWLGALAFILYYHDRAANRARAKEHAPAEPEETGHSMIDALAEPQ